MIDWETLAGDERFKQGTMILNEKSRVVFGRVESIAYDHSHETATIFLKKAVETGDNGGLNAAKIDRFSFWVKESFPLQVDGGAVKFSIYPFGNRGVLMPRGMFFVESVREIAGVGDLRLPYGVID